MSIPKTRIVRIRRGDRIINANANNLFKANTNLKTLSRLEKRNTMSRVSKHLLKSKYNDLKNSKLIRNELNKRGLPYSRLPPQRMLDRAIQKKDETTIKMLIDNGMVDINKRMEVKPFFKPLGRVIQLGLTKTIKLMIDKGIKLDNVGAGGMSGAPHEYPGRLGYYPGRGNGRITQSTQNALHIACSTRKPNIVGMIMKTKKVDVNEVDSFGMTALMYSCDIATYDVVKLLIEGGADIDKISKITNTTALGFLCNMNHKHSQSQRRDITKTLKLLIKHGADINKGKVPPLLDLISNNEFEAIQIMMKHGVDIKKRNTVGNGYVERAIRRAKFYDVMSKSRLGKVEKKYKNEIIASLHKFNEIGIVKESNILGKENLTNGNFNALKSIGLLPTYNDLTMYELTLIAELYKKLNKGNAARGTTALPRDVIREILKKYMQHRSKVKGRTASVWYNLYNNKYLNIIERYL